MSPTTTVEPQISRREGGSAQHSFAPGLRSCALALVLTLAVPLLGLAAAAVWEVYRAERAAAEDTLISTAHTTALLIDRDFSGAERVLQALSGSAALARDDMPAFWGELQTAARGSGAAAIALMGTDGMIRVTTQWPLTEARQVHAVGASLVTLATGQKTITDLYHSPSLGSLAIGVNVPVVIGSSPNEGRVQALGLILPRQRLLATLGEPHLPHGAVAMVTDRTRTIVASTEPDETSLGQKPPSIVLDAMAGDLGMVHPFETMAGTRMVAAYARAPQTGYWVVVGLPESAFSAPVHRALWWLGGIGVPLLLTSLLLATFLTRQLTAALRRLGVTERPLTAGKWSLREVRDLAERLTRTATARNQKIAEGERAVAELRALFDTSPVGVVRSDTGGRVHDANDAFLRIVGMSRDELRNGRIRWDDLTPAEWIGRDEAAIAEAVRLGGCAPYQKAFLRPDGSSVPVLVFFAFDNAAQGSAAAFVVDLSSWEATEADLARAHEQMRLAITAGRMYFWDWNLLTGAVEWSEGLAAAAGLPAGGFGGTLEAFRNLVHPEDLPRIEAALKSASAGLSDYDIEFRMCRPDGGERWVVARGSVVRDGTGRPVRMIGIDMDITDRKRAEAALADSEAQLRTFVERAPAAIAMFDHDMRYLAVSRRFLADYHVSPPDRPAELIGRSHYDVFPELPERWREIHRRVLAGEAGSADDDRFERADGRVDWLRWEMTPWHRRDGSVGGALLSAEIVTERKQAEAVLARDKAELERLVDARTRDLQDTQLQLAHAQRMEALGQLAGGIAHDFNNILQAVQGVAGLIERRIGDPDAVRRLIQLLSEAGHRGTSITRRLLAFSRRSELRAEAVDPSALLADMQEILRHTLGAGVEVRLQIEPGLPTLLADRGQLETVLINLATNARDAMAGGGILTLAADSSVLACARDVPGPGLRGTTSLKAGCYIRLRTIDTGAGMSSEVLARVTEPFFTTKPFGKGTGLGLAMTRAFAEQSAGALAIESTVGTGTTVTLWLPVVEGALPAPVAPAAGAGSRCSHGQGRILLVDDDTIVRGLIGAQLEAAGHVVIPAESGAGALLRLEAAETIDLVIADLSMPGMDGITLIREAQRLRPGLPVILLTGFTTEAASRAAEGALEGGFLLLRKPVSADELTERVAVLLEGAVGTEP